MPTNARKSDHWYSTGGPWGSALLLVGISSTLQGVSYITTNRQILTPTLGWIDHTISINVLGWGWLAAGLWGIYRALTPPQQHSNVLPIAFMGALWSFFYLLHWLYLGLGHGEWTRLWATGLAWACLASPIALWGQCVNPPRGRG